MIELQRNVIFGQYVGTGSIIHRLDPRIKELAAAVLIVAAFFLDSFASFAVLLPLVVLIQFVSRIPFVYLARGSRLFLTFLIIILAFEIVFYPGRIPPGDDLWRWHMLSLSTTGLRWAGIIAVRVLLLYFVTTMLMLTTSLVDLTDGLESLLSPLQRLGLPVNEIILMGVIAMKFVPIFTMEAERLLRARVARGAPYDAGDPLARARTLGALLVPIFISGFRRADALTTAMDARCYRGGMGRTKLRQLRAGRLEWLLLGALMVWVVIAYLAGRAI
jgi:energy-coupling factor transport system permease protein